MFSYIKDRSKENPQVQLLLSLSSFTFSIFADKDATYVKIKDGLLSLSDTPQSERPDFSMIASAEAWANFLSDEPKPGFQTLSTMRRRRHMTVEGDVGLFFRQMLLLEMLFSRLDAGAQNPTSLPPGLESVTGHYLRLDIKGVPHRVYFEEAGSGPPLICLHTAGSDGRQFRHILNDAEITSRFRVIAFDLPWHGKSSPPNGFQHEVYELTTDLYVATIMAFVDAMGLDKPIVMGCSIGGRAVLHLALRHGDRFRAAIGLQSALYAEDISLGPIPPERALHRPDIHGGMLSGASMAGMIAPQSPASERWETMWHYMQGGPGIFHGDVQYYFKDGDLRNGLAEPLRKSPCPIYLLSGEYDPSATPEMGKELAELIGAAHFEVMRGMGHFPMSENPDLFRQYLLPVLKKIEEN
ncbi:MAG: alpha/beta hydrolase [Rhodospirillales bacterium]